jgi:hypothetical protein
MRTSQDIIIRIIQPRLRGCLCFALSQCAC